MVQYIVRGKRISYYFTESWPSEEVDECVSDNEDAVADTSNMMINGVF